VLKTINPLTTNFLQLKDLARMDSRTGSLLLLIKFSIWFLYMYGLNMAEMCCHNRKSIETYWCVRGKAIYSCGSTATGMPTQRHVKPQNSPDQHPHIPQLRLILRAGCAPNAKTNLRDLNCQCRLSNAGIHVQNMSGRQICKTPGLNGLPRPTCPPPCSSRRPDSSEHCH
jgi:hypothetical protein